MKILNHGIGFKLPVIQIDQQHWIIFPRYLMISLNVMVIGHLEMMKRLLAELPNLKGLPVTIIGHQRGKDTKENIRRNFGMPHPEGYRKALRLNETS